MFSIDDYEEKHINPPFPSSNLAALFGKEMTQSAPANTKDVSLSYTAPRQPKTILNPNTNESTQKKNTNSVVFCAKTITLIKQSWTASSTNTNYATNLNGSERLGLALIGNDNLQAYEVILYKDKQNINHRIKVNSKFLFNVDANGKSASFNAENNIVLRVQFQNEQECNEFSECVKNKGGQSVHHNKPLTIPKSSLLRENESTLTSDETLPDNSETLETTSNIVETTDKTANILNTRNETLNMNEIIPLEQKPNPNFRNRLPNEPFSYLTNANSSEPLQNQRQYHRFPFSYNAAPISDITTAYPTNNTFMADNLNSFMAETRSQSCEMRMHMLQLSSKLDTLVRDVSDVKTQTMINQNHKATNSDTINNKSSPIVPKANLEELELKIENFQQENVKLRQHLHESGLEIGRLKNVENENTQLKSDLDTKNVQLNNKLREINDLNQQQFKLQEIINSNSENINSLQTEIDNFHETSEMQKLKLNEFEQYYVRVDKVDSLQKDLENTLDASIKDTMNKLYESILNMFDDNRKCDVEQIKVAIARNLRAASYEMVGNVKSAVKILESAKDN